MVYPTLLAQEILLFEIKMRNKEAFVIYLIKKYKEAIIHVDQFKTQAFARRDKVSTQII